MFRDLTFAAAAQQKTLKLYFRSQRLDLFLHAVNIRQYFHVFLFIQMDIQIQHRLHTEDPLFSVEILPHLHIALSQAVTDIRYHIFPASVALYDSAEWHRVLIPECSVVVPFPLIQEKGPHLTLNGYLLIQRLKLHMVKSDMMPYCLEYIRQISRQLHLLF